MAVSSAEGLERVWRPMPVGRVGAAVLIAVGLFGMADGFGVPLLALIGSEARVLRSSLAVVGFLGLLAVVAWRYGLHPLVGVNAAGVLVRNPIRSIFIPWRDIVGCSASYGGLVIRRRHGWPVVAWAVQKSQLSRRMGYQTRADVVAEYIEARAKRMTSGD
jgi:hypothetical protein